GIDVRGAAVDGDDLADPPVLARATPIVSHRSPPLSTLAIRLMKASQNQYAETLLKTLSLAAPQPSVDQSGSRVTAREGSEQQSATAAGGRAIVRAVLTSWGVADSELIQRDGSGLSRYDYVTADALVAILSHVYRDEKLRAPFE